MTTLEKIRAEIAENQKVISETLSFDKENEFYNGKWAGFELALAVIDKYAEQEKDEPKQEPLTTVKCYERDCNNCTHYVYVSDGQYGCESWECEYDPVLPFKEHYEELAEHYDRRKS